VDGKEALIARTGYTGEDGFEIFVAWEDGPAVWRRILSDGAAAGVLPIGLGARDTLRLEARLSLYGHELEEDISPLEAGLDRWVKLDKDDFLGRDALRRERENGPARGIVGFTTDRRAIPRSGAPVYVGGKQAGAVTSGTFSPTLERGIALALVERPLPEAGGEVEVELRGKRVAGEVVEGPFYRKPAP
jgi:aminomethyltransferase